MCRILRRACVFGLYDGGVAGVHERPAPTGSEEDYRGRFWVVRAKRTVLAAGAIERGFAFEGNDRPGVMTANAARAYANRFAVAAGKRGVIATNNDSAYAAARDLARAGVEVTLCDSRPDGAPDELSEGFEVLRGFAPVATVGGRGGVRAVEVTSTRSQPGGRVIPCTFVGVSGGWNPTVHLASHRGDRPVWDAALAAFVPLDGKNGIVVAGSARGIWGGDDCVRSGRAAASVAARELGRSVDAPEMPDRGGWRADIAPLYECRKSGGVGAKSFVDLQNDVTAADIRLSAAEGFTGAEHLKRYTTLGMSPDQGKTSNVVALGILGEATGRPLDECGVTTFRPPYDPVELGALGGRARGRGFRPVRRSPAHAWHNRTGGVMIDSGVWRRPWYYPRLNETVNEAYVREAAEARATVGLSDVSSLGKIAVQGPDAGAFLDRVYVNGFSKLPVGRARYGVMLRDDGIVFDDGTTWRLGEYEWFMTTTTALSGPVMTWLEYLLAVRFPDLRAHLTSVTDQWFGAAVAGPRAREVLSGVTEGVDLSDEAFPFMGVREGALRLEGGAAPCRIARISFSGELGYEIYVGADYGEAAMQALADGVAEAGGALYGLEALGALRIEKGHVTGAELDGRVTLTDAGLGRMASKTKAYIGRALAKRPELLREDRPRLVGVMPVDESETFAGGSVLCAETDVRGHGVGWVSSVTHSPALATGSVSASRRAGPPPGGTAWRSPRTRFGARRPGCGSFRRTCTMPKGSGSMVERVSALAAAYESGRFGAAPGAPPGVRLAEIANPSIVQFATWTRSLSETGRRIAAMGGATSAPPPGRWTPWGGGMLARVEPLKFWAIAAEASTRPLFEMDSEDGAALDLSHSRTGIRIDGKDAVALVQRYLAVDISASRFPDGSVASGLLDHISGTLLRADVEGQPSYDLYVPRTYAQSFWEEFYETARQFGVEVRDRMAGS